MLYLILVLVSERDRYIYIHQDMDSIRILQAVDVMFQQDMSNNRELMSHLH